MNTLRADCHRASVVLSTLISAVIGNMVLPGSKIIVASRLSKKSDVDAFHHIVQVSGFTGERVNEFVCKFASGCTEEEDTFIKITIKKYANMAEFCQVPLQCDIVCAYLGDMYKFAKGGETPNLNTTTDLFLQVPVRNFTHS